MQSYAKYSSALSKVESKHQVVFTTYIHCSLLGSCLIFLLIMLKSLYHLM